MTAVSKETPLRRGTWSVTSPEAALGHNLAVQKAVEQAQLQVGLRQVPIGGHGPSSSRAAEGSGSGIPLPASAPRFPYSVARKAKKMAGRAMAVPFARRGDFRRRMQPARLTAVSCAA